MLDTEKKINKMIKLNNEALAKIIVANKLFINLGSKDYSLQKAITETGSDLKKNCVTPSSDLSLKWLIERSDKTKEILSIFNADTYRSIRALRNANKSTFELLENPLKDVKHEIEETYGINYCIKEIREDPTGYNGYILEIVNDIEKKYKAILSLIKRATNKWYNFITGKQLVVTLFIITLISIIAFFVLRTHVTQADNISQAVQIKASESAKKIKAISNDTSLNFGQKITKTSELITSIIGIIPQILLLLSILIWIIQAISGPSGKSSGRLKNVQGKINELLAIIKGG